MPTARELILTDVRRQLPVDAPLPLLEGPWTQYADPAAHFLEVLAGVGGRGVVVPAGGPLVEEAARIVASLGARRIFSAVPAAHAGTMAHAEIAAPHDMADVDLAIMPGELAVAENAAVWITDAGIPERSAFFLAQHLTLVVPAGRIVHNMHEAYAWLEAQSPGGGPFAIRGFGAFISGPSKTADIEQSLVIGAHGARSLNVLLVE